MIVDDQKYDDKYENTRCNKNTYFYIFFKRPKVA